MKLPEVGEIFYWKDENGKIYEDICQKIEKDDYNDIETMFFTYVTENGGGVFVTESDIISSDSKEVKEFKEKKVEEKIKEISDYISQEEVYKILYDKIRKNHFSESNAKYILDILTK